MQRKELTSKSLKVLRIIYEMCIPKTVYTMEMKQSALAKKLGISRQALSSHLRRLRNLGLIRTGRGFIDVLEKGLDVLGVGGNPAIVTVKVEPGMRGNVYKNVMKYPVLRVFRVAGDIDLILLVEQKKLGSILQMLASLDGVRDTKSYVTIETLR
ncbi:MAG: AsnC family transcriptional regulator [Thaumarchaeota archaeon]|nr:MAG: AsnC family transcriptional regulator [Nitrososphaerota archaeon]